MTTKTAQDDKGSCCIPTRSRSSDVSKPMPLVANAAAPKDVSERVKIPGGDAIIGTATPIIIQDEEGPIRRKKLSAFLMDEAQVTTGRFRRFVEATGYVTDAERLGNSFVFYAFLPQGVETRGVAQTPWWREVDGACWHSPTGAGSDTTGLDDHPVVHVTWNDAKAFAKWAGGRLPSEAEWEHAARGGLGDVRFPWGDRTPDDDTFFPCNLWQGHFPDHNLEKDGYFATAPAKSFEPNGYGLYNMVGNAWDYTADPFRLRSLKKAARSIDLGRQGYKLSKGGSFVCHASYCYRYRIAARTGTSPDSSTSHQSFRLVYAVSR